MTNIVGDYYILPDVNINMRTYREWFDIVRLAADHGRSIGKKYRDGVERSGAIAAASAPTKTAAMDRLVKVIDSHEFKGHWDGSIG